MLSSVDDQFSGVGVSSMDSGEGVLRGRPHGGLGILWKKSLGGCDVMDMRNPRLMGITVASNENTITLFNVYMPCDDKENLDEYLQILAYLSAAVEESESPYIAMLGDFNANLKPGLNTLFGDELR